MEEHKGREIVEYRTEADVSPFDRWLKKSIDERVRSIVRVRLTRIQHTGNFGDCRPVGDGVMELRFFEGPGYRVYYGLDGDAVVLLAGGDKSTQVFDIQKAKERWADYNA